ncbi:GNAT family N-acetyltransferase [Mycetocola reblochoni]|uniref:GNAT family N-acetyltransferase n=1 Tax=Mycetocola reblochoni TaxID=331618 RepID=UPI003F98AD58
MSTSITHDADAGRFTLLIDDERAGSLDYSRGDGRVAITHTYTDPAFRGRGIAAELAVRALAEDPGLPIVAACPYVAHWFAQHPERAHLLAGA